jgi:hypothetical protein
MWNLTAPPGFRGLRSDEGVTVYVRHLPHWRQRGATYFVTFRLADSLSQAKLRELAAWRDQWWRQHPLYRCLQYIGSNAARAGLPLDACPRWVRFEWESLGWRFADT